MIGQMLRRLDIYLADRLLPWRDTDGELYPVGSRINTSTGDEYEIRWRAYDFDDDKVWYLLEGEGGDPEYAVHHAVSSNIVITPDGSRTSAGDSS